MSVTSEQLLKPQTDTLNIRKIFKQLVVLFFWNVGGFQRLEFTTNQL